MSSNLPVMESVYRADGCPDIAHYAHVNLIYLGQTSLLCETPQGELIPITTARRGLVPGGLSVTEDSFAQVAATLGDTPRPIPLNSLLPGADHAPTITLQMPALALDPRVIERAEVALAHHHSEHIEELWGHCRAIMVSHDAAEAREHLQAVIGAGIGATPTGDDMLTGALAALWASRSGNPHEVIPHWLQRAIGALAPRTTRISRMQLGAALAGKFASSHLEIAVHLSAGRVSAALDCAQQIGHTSGIDFLHGFTTYPYFQRRKHA